MTRCNDQVSASTLGVDSFEKVRRGPTGRRRSLLLLTLGSLGLDFFFSAADDTNTGDNEDILRLVVELFIVRRASTTSATPRTAPRRLVVSSDGGAAKGEDKQNFSCTTATATTKAIPAQLSSSPHCCPNLRATNGRQAGPRRSDSIIPTKNETPRDAGAVVALYCGPRWKKCPSDPTQYLTQNRQGTPKRPTPTASRDPSSCWTMGWHVVVAERNQNERCVGVMTARLPHRGRSPCRDARQFSTQLA
jgi:hypothetical protein